MNLTVRFSYWSAVRMTYRRDSDRSRTGARRPMGSNTVVLIQLILELVIVDHNRADLAVMNTIYPRRLKLEAIPINDYNSIKTERAI